MQQIFIQPLKKGDPVICQKMDEPEEHNDKWMPDTEKILHNFTYICNIFKNQIYRENETVVTRGKVVGKKWENVDQRTQSSRYEGWTSLKI